LRPLSGGISCLGRQARFTLAVAMSHSDLYPVNYSEDSW
jgi:hypothetical protein